MNRTKIKEKHFFLPLSMINVFNSRIKSGCVSFQNKRARIYITRIPNKCSSNILKYRDTVLAIIEISKCHAISARISISVTRKRSNRCPRVSTRISNFYFWISNCLFWFIIIVKNLLIFYFICEKYIDIKANKTKCVLRLFYKNKIQSSKIMYLITVFYFFIFEYTLVIWNQYCRKFKIWILRCVFQLYFDIFAYWPHKFLWYFLSSCLNSEFIFLFIFIYNSWPKFNIEGNLNSQISRRCKFYPICKFCD